MLEKVKFVVRLNNAGFHEFLYRIVMDRPPTKITKLPLYRWFDTVISYDVPASAARYLAGITGVYVPESTGLEKLRVNFRGGNSYLSRLNASAKLTWYFKRSETADEFGAHLGPFLDGLAIGLPSESAAPAPEPEITLGTSITSLELNAFRTIHRWLFEILMPCELAQRAFTESYMLGRSGVSTFITNLYIESVQHLKRCDKDSCVQFAFENEALARSLIEVNKIM